MTLSKVALTKFGYQTPLISADIKDAIGIDPTWNKRRNDTLYLTRKAKVDQGNPTTVVLHNIALSYVPMTKARRVETIKGMRDLISAQFQLRWVEFGELLHSVATNDPIV